VQLEGTDMRVVIVAEHPLMAEAVRRGLRHTPGCQVLGYVDGRRSCSAPLANAAPDVIILDEPRSSETALTWIRDVRAAAPDAKLILLTTRMEPSWLAEAAAAGIDAAVGKSSRAESIGMLVREVAAGNIFHAFKASPTPPTRDDHAADGLTARELQILTRVAAGASNSRIAAELWVTEQTVKFHLSNLYRKLGVANRTQASHYAHVHGLLESPHVTLAPAAPAAAMAVAA
jgi:DNA-binding NarL/FixJ family response regulator